MIIGRINELKILNNAFEDNSSHFVAIYGRRRVGKTFLIRETFGGKMIFQHSGLSNGNLKEQLYAFDSSLSDYGYRNDKKSVSWLEAFSKLKGLVTKSEANKKVIFLDEISWMDTSKSDFLMALEYFWNSFASARKDILLIVCSSATSWILNKLIHNKGGLYNRVTERIHLEPFSLFECEEYLKNRGILLTRMQILEYYMIFGGVPFYWSFIEKGLSLTQIVDKLLFGKNALLKDEFNYLYSSIFKNEKIYLTIVEALSKKKIGMTREEIIENTKITNSGDLTIKLEELEACGFIRKYYSFKKTKKDALYQLIDNFTLFYYTFLEKGITYNHFWSNQINTPLINTWKGLSFERVCLLHIKQIKDKLGISRILTDVCSWYCKSNKDEGICGSQIDLLIVRRDQVINICEIKYSTGDYYVNESFEQNMMNKINYFQLKTKTKYAIHPILITTYGLGNSSFSIQETVNLDDLFKE